MLSRDPSPEQICTVDRMLIQARKAAAASAVRGCEVLFSPATLISRDPREPRAPRAKSKDQER